MKVIYLLPTREKEVAVYKVTANNTKKTLIVAIFDQALGACNNVLFYKVILDTFFRISGLLCIFFEEKGSISLPQSSIADDIYPFKTE